MRPTMSPTTGKKGTIFPGKNGLVRPDGRIVKNCSAAKKPFIKTDPRKYLKAL
jgi:hypothetical protein